MLTEFRECPGTWTLAATWVLVFALMQLVQGGPPANLAKGKMVDPLPVLTTTSHRFGDMTWPEVRRGEVWRVVTATFIHFGLIHIVMNLVGLIQLGRLVEPWYGTGPFLAVCLAIGGLGNLIGGIMRHGLAIGRTWLATSGLARTWPGLVDRIGGGHAVPINIHTGGGSTILLGLLALAAVVGWRSKTRIGGFLRDQMVSLLGITVVLGIVLSNLVDNFGHAGGAIAGALIGFAHRPLFRLGEQRWARRSAWGLVACLSVLCVAAGLADDRADVAFERGMASASDRFRLDFQAIQDLERLYALFGRTIARSPIYLDPLRELDHRAMTSLFPDVAPPNRDPVAEREQIPKDRLELEEVLDRLEKVPSDGWGPEVRPDLERLRALGRASMVDVPRFDQAYEFIVCLRTVLKAVAIDRARVQGILVDLHQIGK